MSWLYSRALVAAYSGANSLDGEPCALLNVMHTPHPFWLRDRTMGTWSHSQFGLTYQPLTESLGGGLLTWYLAGFHAKTLVAPAAAKESTGQEAGFGEKWHESFAKFNPDTSSWKIRQLWLFGDSDESLEIWPKWGLMLNGECWEATPLETRTIEPECGWLPAPIKGDFRFFRHTVKGARNKKHIGHGQTHIVHEASEHVLLGDSERILANPQFYEEIMSLPDSWTDLRPLETPKMQAWLNLHGTP